MPRPVRHSRGAIANDEGLRALFKGVSINVFKVYRLTSLPAAALGAI